MKICLISNFAAHYRKEIYELMDSQLKCDFVFGDTLENGIESFDLTNFRNKVTILENIQRGEVTIWQKGVLSNLRNKYDRYIISDDIRCLSTWFFLILSKILGKKVYFWAHGWYGRENILKKILKKIFYSLPNGVFLYGNYSRELMIDNGFPPDKLWVIHNSLAYSKQLEIRLKLKNTDIYKEHFSNLDPTLIFIGRLTASKKLDMIINAMGILQDQSVYCNLVFVGDGPASGILKELVIKNRIENRVWFYGPCYDEDHNAELIYNADVCVSPGNIGLTAIHVMMYGTPAITHNCFPYQGPEFEAIHPQMTGDFYEYESEISLAETIKSWLQHSKSQREVIRGECYKEVDNWWTPNYQIGIIQKHL